MDAPVHPSSADPDGPLVHRPLHTFLRRAFIVLWIILAIPLSIAASLFPATIISPGAMGAHVFCTLDARSQDYQAWIEMTFWPVFIVYDGYTPPSVLSVSFKPLSPDGVRGSNVGETYIKPDTLSAELLVSGLRAGGFEITDQHRMEMEALEQIIREIFRCGLSAVPSDRTPTGAPNLNPDGSPVLHGGGAFVRAGSSYRARDSWLLPYWIVAWSIAIYAALTLLPRWLVRRARRRRAARSSLESA